MTPRAAGILLHLSCLPGPFGVGDMGPGAHAFAERLAACGMSLWQLLPLNPTDPARGNSPYNSSSAFAGDPLFISLEMLRDQGLLTDADLRGAPAFEPSRVDYPAARSFKTDRLRRAFAAWSAAGPDTFFDRFCQRQAYWLDDHCLFSALGGQRAGELWCEWPEELARREPGALQEAQRELAGEIRWHQFCQYLFQWQWNALRRRCRALGIRILGDAPIYVDLNSVDVWAHPEMFKLDQKGRPRKVAGVPPDYFSATGQLWGNPVYDWTRLGQDGYSWWIARVQRNLELFDLMRIDHFRGLVGYWEVPAGDKTAENGEWVPAPAGDFLQKLFRRIPSSTIVAEDLGTITPDVREVMRTFELPGMRLLLFAFGDDHADHPYLPHNLPENCIAYTGTHDNNTALGWLTEDAGAGERRRLFRYLGREMADRHVVWEMIRMLYMSAARQVIVPLQDALGLPGSCRMNLPSTPGGNWGWRATAEQLAHPDLDFLGHLAWVYGRRP